MRIMLACNVGASTSIIVKKMQDAAKELNEDHEIWATDFCSINSYLGKFDVLLLGPQIAFSKSRYVKLVGNTVPVEVINPMDYGRLRGDKILSFAKQLVEKEIGQ